MPGNMESSDGNIEGYLEVLHCGIFIDSNIESCFEKESLLQCLWFVHLSKIDFRD